MPRFVGIILGIISILFLVYIGDRINQGGTQASLRTLAKDTLTNLNKNNVDYWVDYGTLLGIVRDKDIIKHDTDVDICLIQEPELPQKLIQTVKDMGRNYHLEYHPWGAFRIIKTGPFSKQYWADLYLITTDREKNLYIDPTGKIPTELVGNKQEIFWQNIPVKVPEKLHETLVWRYGKNYLTPQRGKKNENFT